MNFKASFSVAEPGSRLPGWPLVQKLYLNMVPLTAVFQSEVWFI